jgi:lipopolysaccharide export LptBFGC system permease protein LptF
MNGAVPQKLELHGLTIFEIDDRFLPVKRIDALAAKYHPPPSSADSSEDSASPTWVTRIVPRHFQDFLSAEIQVDQSQELGHWTLAMGTERTFNPTGKRSIITFEERSDYVIPHSFQEFRRETKDPEDMNYQELAKYIETLRASGYDASKYVVDLRAKFSYPVVSFVMVIIGFPFALRSPRSGAAMGLGLSVFIGLTYWIVLQLGISLGHANMLPPTLAAWISHILFAAAGCYLILSTRT